MSQPRPLLVVLLNKTDLPGSRIIAHCVPTRIIRIVDVKDDGMTFRVEQLVTTSPVHAPDPKGSWTTKSTHGGQRPAEALGEAFKAAHAAQKKLTHGLKRRLGIPE
jgi:hypothetical protein